MTGRFDIESGCAEFGTVTVDRTTRRRAAITTARHARNHQDLAQLLDVFGLLPDADTAAEPAADPAA